MKYNPHNDWLTKRIAEHEELAKSFGNGSHYADLLATLKQAEAQHLRVLQERNNFAQEAYERGKREGIAEGFRRGVNDVIVRVDDREWLLINGFGTAVWDLSRVLERHYEDVLRGEHVAEGGE